MIKYRISKPNTQLNGTISIPPTRSLSNKFLVIRVLQNAKLLQHTDTETEAQQIINKSIFDKGIKQTRGRSAQAIRHIRAFINFFGGEWILSSSDILKGSTTEKIARLLQKYGLNVIFEERVGNPPFRLIGKNLKGKILRVDGSINSKVIEARMLVDPSLSYDEILELKNLILARGYPQMTLRALQFMGVNANWDENEILIEHTINDGTELTVEADWSLALYWYEAIALSGKGDITIQGLNPTSLQNEMAVATIFNKLGVTTQIVDDNIRLQRKGKVVKQFSHNFRHYPDLAPAIIFTCLGMEIPFIITGVESFHQKEPDRLEAITKQFEKLGASLQVYHNGDEEVIEFNGKWKGKSRKEFECDSLDDHRLAMSLVPLTLLGKTITLENPRITSKSYTTFWDEIRKVGFEFTII